MAQYPTISGREADSCNDALALVEDVADSGATRRVRWRRPGGGFGVLDGTREPGATWGTQFSSPRKRLPERADIGAGLAQGPGTLTTMGPEGPSYWRGKPAPSGFAAVAKSGPGT